MNNINLITYRNKYYDDILSQEGYIIKKYNGLIDDLEPEKILNNQTNSIFIIEIDNYNFKSINYFINKISLNCRIIIIAKEIPERVKEFLLKKGIMDLIKPDNPERLISLLKILNKKIDLKSGRIIIFDENFINQKLLGNIISRFNYEPHIVSSIDGLLNSLKLSNLQFIFLNIGIDKLDLTELIKKYHSRADLKKIPIIAYKDMEKGLYIHEIVRGLNKLTKYILSIEELCSFIIDILFKKNIFTTISNINYTANFEKFSYYSNNVLSKIFYSNEDDLFPTKPNIFCKTEKIFNISEKIQEVILQADSLKWLIMETKKTDISTCGAGD